MYRKRLGCLIQVFLMTLALFTGLTMQVRADEATELNHDVVFVIDASYSMRTSDQKNLSAEAAKLFMDMCVQSSSRVGYVIYDDTIIDTGALRSIRDPYTVDSIKQVLDKSAEKRVGYTDIGLALKAGVELLLDAPAEEGNRHPLVILLSDGKTDLDPKSTRTLEDSEKDLNKAIEEAKKASIPVYTIALNYQNSAQKSNVDPEKMGEIARKTEGLSYQVTEADQLPEVLSEIFTTSMKTTLQFVDEFIGDGNSHEVIISIPNASIYEANIIILSGKAVSGIQLWDPSGEKVSFTSGRASISSSSVYTLIKLFQPVTGNWKLSLVGATGDDVTINLVSYYGIDLALELSGTEFLPGEAIQANLFFERDGERVDDKALTTGADAVLTIWDENGEETSIPMTAQDNCLTAQFDLPKVGEYTVFARAVAKDKAYDKTTEKTEVRVKAPPISSVGSGESELKMFSALFLNDKQTDFASLFSYEPGTELALSAPKQAEEKWSDYCDIVTNEEEGYLRIESRKAGEFDATVMARDAFGQTATHVFHIVIYPIWPVFAAGGLLLAILALVIVLILQGKKLPLSGRLYVSVSVADANGVTMFVSKSDSINLDAIKTKKGKNSLPSVMLYLNNEQLKTVYNQKLAGLDEIKNASLEKRRGESSVLYLIRGKNAKNENRESPIGSVQTSQTSLSGVLPGGERFTMAFRYDEKASSSSAGPIGTAPIPGFTNQSDFSGFDDFDDFDPNEYDPNFYNPSDDTEGDFLG